MAIGKKKKVRTPIPAEIDTAVRVEAGYRCSMPRCGETSGLEVHHIDGNPSNHDPANLLVLCAVCHARVTRGDIPRQACKMIKREVSLRSASPDQLQQMRDEIIFEMRSLMGLQPISRPLLKEEKGSLRPDVRVEVMANQAMILDKATIKLPVGILRPITYSLYKSCEFEAGLAIQRIVVRTADAEAGDWSNLGLFLEETDRNDEAEKAYGEAIDRDPSCNTAWSNFGVLLRKMGRREEAENAQRKAIDINPDNAKAWCNLGNLLKDKGRREEAEAAYRKAIELDPKLAEAWTDLGILMDELGHKTEAEKAHRKAVGLNPMLGGAWDNLAVFLEGEGRMDESEEARRQSIKASVHNADQHNGLAYLLWECGRFEDAELEVMEALKDDPSHVYAHATLGLLRLEQNDLDEGRQGYEKAIKLAPDDLALRQKYHFEYGRALARNGRKDEARKELDAALKVDSAYVPREQIEAELAKLG